MDLDTQTGPLAFRPRHDTMVGVDSDGCVFDTMEIKQQRFFHPRIIETWGLSAIERQLRETAETVNLYSRWRGSNRFTALLKVFELLRQRPDVRRSGVSLPDTTSLAGYVNSGLPLGNPSLAREAQRTGDPELGRILKWSEAVNDDIDKLMDPIPPFRNARRALESMADQSDLVVISQTPSAALAAEWCHHSLEVLVRFIAGQEIGPKTRQLQLAAAGRYSPERILMIGDAPGDLHAARETGACFYPIMPGEEEDGWECLLRESYGRFIDDSYRGEYEQALINEFEARLPPVLNEKPRKGPS